MISENNEKIKTKLVNQYNNNNNDNNKSNKTNLEENFIPYQKVMPV